MSPDVSAMFAQMTGAPQTYSPGTYGNAYTAPGGTVSGLHRTQTTTCRRITARRFSL
jgi:hypothetical protein